MAKNTKATNKTSKKLKPAPVAVNTSANPPTKTLRSRGFFYISEKPKGSGKWRVMFESWKDGKKTQTQVSKAMISELGRFFSKGRGSRISASYNTPSL